MLKPEDSERSARRLAALGADERRALPAGLRRRLLEIPDAAGTCDTGRVYEAAWQEAWQGRVDDGVVRHLEGCARCAALYALLCASFGRTRRLPSSARDRLRAIVRPAALPSWLREARLAVAACWLVSLVLTSLAGDAQALFRETTEVMTTTAFSWADESEQMWRALVAGSEDGWSRGRDAVVRYGETWERLFEKTRDFYDHTSIGQWLDGDTNDEGDNDDDRSPSDES